MLQPVESLVVSRGTVGPPFVMCEPPAQTRITQYHVRTEKIHVPKMDIGILRMDATTQWDSDDEVICTDGSYNVPLHHRHHTVIRNGKDNSILGYHIPQLYLEDNGIDSAYIAELVELVEDLPPPAQKGDETRGIEDARNYQPHVGSKQDKEAAERGDERTGLLSYSADYIRDGEKGRRVKERCARLWAVIGKVHEKAFDAYGKELRNYRKPASAQGEFLAAPWPGMAINRGRVGRPVRCMGHKDMKDEPFSVTALFVFGPFTGGEEILWQVMARVELKSGDGFLFPGRVIAHSNAKVFGIRHSLVAYAPQETMSYNQHRKAIENYKRRHEKLHKKRTDLRKAKKREDLKQ